MNEYHSDIYHDLSTSCTKNVAIGRILGIFSSDPILINHNFGGDSVNEQQKYLDGLEISIFEIINDEREAAQSDRDDAIEKGDKVKKDECTNRILQWDNKMRLAHQYLCELDDELAKGEDSALRVDPVATTSSENSYITLASLTKWSEDVVNKIQRRIERSDPYIKNISSAKEANKVEELKTDAATNLYATFALLVDDFATKNSGYCFKSGGINMKAVSEYIEQLGINKTKNLSNSVVNIIPGLTAGKISDNISIALKRLQEKLA